MSILIDLTGKKFGKLTVIKRDTSYVKIVRWICKCDCGNTKTVRGYCLKDGTTISCGCLSGKSNIGKRRPDGSKKNIGKKFNRLTIISIKRNPKQRGYWMVCRCDCGNTTKQMYADIKKGKVVSCGCHNKEQQSINGSNVGLNNSTKAGNKYGWYFIKNGKKIKMRSGYEVMYAIILENNKTEWQYEPKCFKLQDGMRYTPDFYLPKTNEWIEVKGRYKDRDRIKHQIFINQGNKLTLIFIDDIQKQLPYSYAKFKKDWVTNHRVADTIIAESGLTNFSTAQNNSKIGVSYGI